MQQQTPAATLTLRFRTEQFRPYGKALGIITETQIADAVGLDRSTVNRLLRGTAPGDRTIAAFLRAFPDRRFEDFFEVTGTVTTRIRAA